MSTHPNPAKTRLIRKHILQLARELYLHPQTDRSVRENLMGHFHDITADDVRGHFLYLAENGLLHLRKNRQELLAQVTPKGIDVLDGAREVRGVERANPQLGRLSYKKEIRRGILLYCYTFRGLFNEDAEIHAEFKSTGFSNLLMEEVRFHIWYLRHKGYLELKTPDLGGDRVFMARITADGVEIIENHRADEGITHDGE